MSQPLASQGRRLSAVDALRGAALLAIVLLHHLEHYNLYHIPADMPAWLQALDKGVWETTFFLLAGKAYATFALLFGFSFYIQLESKGPRPGMHRRFAWRMLLLLGFAQLHALVYNGDILLLYASMGLTLLATHHLGNRSLMVLAVLLLMQPQEWVRIGYSLLHPDYQPDPWMFMQYATPVDQAMRSGSLLEVLRSNLTEGQLLGNLWQIEHGRLLQIPAFFMLGLLAGRTRLFESLPENPARWRRLLVVCTLAFLPLWASHVWLAPMAAHPGIGRALEVLLPSAGNAAFMGVLVALFLLAYHRKPGVWQHLVPFGRMSLTNYILQSAIGVCLYYGFGLGLYQYTGASLCLLIGLGSFGLQWAWSRHWLQHHRQGPLEWLWRKATWMGQPDRQQAASVS